MHSNFVDLSLNFVASQIHQGPAPCPLNTALYIRSGFDDIAPQVLLLRERTFEKNRKMNNSRRLFRLTEFQLIP